MKRLFIKLILGIICFFIITSTFAQTIQEQLNTGKTVKELLASSVKVDSLIGKYYQGGLIFYVDQTTGSGFVTSTSNLGYANWGCSGVSLNVKTKTIGSGEQNTNDIISACNDIIYAASLCKAYINDGYSDWFLPSYDELNEMYTKLHLKGLGNFNNTYYCSSSEISANGAFAINFTNGAIATYLKNAPTSVRAIRQFDKPTPPTVKDGEGNTYNTVKIGKQVWMKENLKTRNYTNGEPIATTTPADLDLGSGNKPNFQWAYQGIDSIANISGRLYTWYAVMDNRGICPIGWHVATDNDWMKMLNYLDNTVNLTGTGWSGYDIGIQLKSTAWVSGNGTDASGFSAMNTGYRPAYGVFNNIASYSYWWSASEKDSVSARYLALINSKSSIIGGPDAKNAGMAVRCVQNQTNFRSVFLTDSINNNTYAFKDTSIGDVVKRVWDFGDGSTANTINPTHTFKNNGFYKVSLTVMDISGQQSTSTRTIHIGKTGCQVDFVFDAVTPTKYNFVAQPSGINNLYNWDFGDATTANTKLATHTFTSASIKNVCLSIYDQSAACKDITCKSLKIDSTGLALTASLSYVIDSATKTIYFTNLSKGPIDTYLWNFGDGYTSTMINPSHIYTNAGYYTVHLRVANSKTKKYDNALVVIDLNTGNNKIKAAFGFAVDSTFYHKGVLPIEFKGAGYGDASEVEWDFGDGTTNSTTTSPTHSYNEGQYNVCYTITNSNTGQQDTYCDSVEVVVTGMEESVSESVSSEFEMWPNPARNQLIIKNEKLKMDHNEMQTVVITNTLGQIVFHSSFFIFHSSLNIDVSQFGGGVYFVRIGNTVKKLIVNN